MKSLASTPPSASASPPIRHNYRNGSIIEIQFFRVDTFTGELENRIFQDMRWTSLPSLPDFDFLAADLNLIRELAEGKYL